MCPTLGEVIHCSGCGTVFARTRLDRTKCKACEKAYASKWRQKRRDAGLSTSGTRPTAEYLKAYGKDYGKRPEVRERRNELMRGYYRGPLHPRHKARNKLNKAIRAGLISRGPCETCGSIETHGHHDDYSKPLEVRWLCRTHHDALHSKNGNNT